MYPLPDSTTITVFGKKGCLYCKKACDWLTAHNKQFVYLDCTQYTITKEKFFEHINSIESVRCADRTVNTFPIVFDKEVFVGGFSDLEKPDSSIQTL